MEDSPEVGGRALFGPGGEVEEEVKVWKWKKAAR